MGKKYFVLKSLGNRDSFPQDMSDNEKTIMQEHVKYWTELADKGIALVFGPVFEPEERYGLGIIGIDNEDDISPLLENDPAIKGEVLTTKVFQFNPVLSKFWTFEK